MGQPPRRHRRPAAPQHDVTEGLTRRATRGHVIGPRRRECGEEGRVVAHDDPLHQFHAFPRSPFPSERMLIASRAMTSSTVENLPAVRVLVLRTGQAIDPVHAHCGPFSRMFERGLNRGNVPVIVDEHDVTVHAADDPLPALYDYDGVIMTGSPAFVGDDAPWMRWGARVLLDVVTREQPLLAVCFGHQLLGVALGADVGPNPRGREMGTIDVQLAHGLGDDVDVLFGAVPQQFRAQCTHRDVIRAPGEKLRVLATSAHDPNHIVQAGPVAFGVQFHPEFNEDTMRVYLEVRRPVLDSELGAGEADARLARLAPTPHAASLLPRFANLCRERRHGRS
jgi:GMP synthase (glutamine-hydrolysing)